MKWIIDFVTNPYFIAGMSSWMIAQVAKTIIYAIVNKKIDISRVFGDGGMPSGHSATVTALAVITGMVNGTGTAEFAIAAVLAIIVCHDAMGVRLETGKQTVLLNELVKAFTALTSKELPEVKLKEFVGHTPVQVLAGMLLGAVNAVLVYYLWI